MADINSKVTIDTTQASTSLDSLGASAKSANASLSQFKVTASGDIVSAFDGTTKGAEKLAQQTEKVGKSTEQAAKNANALSLSWETIGRVVQTQVILRGVNELTQGFFESAEAAQELELSLQRIAAISEEGLGSLDDLEEQVKALAISLGRDLGETSEAVFEALQNDLGTTAQTFELLEGPASDLALVTGGTLPEAVNALSSVLKVYAEDGLEAAEASEIFFGAINAGRITLQEMESRLGTVLPLAERVGVDFREAASAIATISLAGVDAATSSTQLRNVLNKLIKPTEELEAAFVGLRVNGAEELVEREGDLVGALAAIADELGNDETKIAKAFNTIRGNLGVFNILANDGRTAAGVLATVDESGQRLAETIDSIKLTEAFEAQQNAAELEVIFTDLGKTSLELKNDITVLFLTFITDSEDAKVAITAFTTATIGATAALAAARFGLLGLGAAAASAAPSILLISGVLGAFAVGAVLGVGVSKGIDAITDSFKGLNDESAKFEIASLKEVEKTINAINVKNIEDLDEAFNDVNSTLNTTIREANELRDTIVEGFDEATAALSGAGQSLLKRFGDQRKRILDSIGKSIDDIDKNIADNLVDLAEARADLEEITFEKSIRDLKAADQATKSLERATRQVAEAVEDANTVGLGDTSREAAEATLDNAERAAELALKYAEAAENVNQIRSAELSLENVQRGRVALLERSIQLQQELPRDALREQLAALSNLNEAQKDQIGGLLEEYQKVTKAAEEGIGTEELAGRTDDIRRQLADIIGGLGEFDQAPIVDLFDFDGVASALSTEVASGLAALDVSFDQAIFGLKEQLQSEQFDATVELGFVIDENALSTEVQRILASITTDDPTARLEQSQTALQQLAKDQAEAAGEVEAAGAKFNTSIATATARLEEALGGTLFTGASEAGTRILQPVSDNIENLSNLSEQELTALQSQIIDGINTLGETSVGIFGEIGSTRADDIQATLDAALDAVQARLTIIRNQGLFSQQSITDIGNIFSSLETLGQEQIPLNFDTKAIDDAALGIDAITESASEASKAIASIGESAIQAQGGVSALDSTTQGLVGTANSAARAYENLVKQIQRAINKAAEAPSGPPSGTPSFHGGPISYRQNGGPISRGQDTLLTPTAPGEHISNQKATRNFFPELQAMNSGNFSRGGSADTGDTNITVGDINISTTSQLPTQTARETGQAIQRELRKRTLKI